MNGEEEEGGGGEKRRGGGCKNVLYTIMGIPPHPPERKRPRMYRAKGG